MKKYSSIDLLKKLFLKLYATDIIYDNVNTVEFKIAIDLMQHVNITYDNHFIVISPIEYDGSTDYIIDDLSNDEHNNQCDNMNNICDCILSIVKTWFE